MIFKPEFQTYVVDGDATENNVPNFKNIMVGVGTPDGNGVTTFEMKSVGCLVKVPITNRTANTIDKVTLEVTNGRYSLNQADPMSQTGQLISDMFCRVNFAPNMYTENYGIGVGNIETTQFIKSNRPSATTSIDCSVSIPQNVTKTVYFLLPPLPASNISVHAVSTYDLALTTHSGSSVISSSTKSGFKTERGTITTLDLDIQAKRQVRVNGTGTWYDWTSEATFPVTLTSSLRKIEVVCTGSDSSLKGAFITTLGNAIANSGCPNGTVTLDLTRATFDGSNAAIDPAFSASESGGKLSKNLKLKEVNFPNRTVGAYYWNYAFNGCTYLQKVTGLITAFSSNYIFQNCTSLNCDINMISSTAISGFAGCTSFNGSVSISKGPFQPFDGVSFKSLMEGCTSFNNDLYISDRDGYATSASSINIDRILTNCTSFGASGDRSLTFDFAKSWGYCYSNPFVGTTTNNVNLMVSRELDIWVGFSGGSFNYPSNTLVIGRMDSTSSDIVPGLGGSVHTFKNITILE